jgi:heme exporter protein D
MGNGTDILESARDRVVSVAGGPARLQIIAVLAAILAVESSALGTVSGGGQSGLMWTFLIMLIPMLVASALGVWARKTYLRDVATAAASSRASKS